MRASFGAHTAREWGDEGGLTSLGRAEVGQPSSGLETAGGTHALPSVRSAMGARVEDSVDLPSTGGPADAIAQHVLSSSRSPEEEGEPPSDSGSTNSDGADVEPPDFSKERALEAQRAQQHALELAEFAHAEQHALQSSQDERDLDDGIDSSSSAAAHPTSGEPGPLMRELFGRVEDSGSLDAQAQQSSEHPGRSGSRFLSRLKERRSAAGRRKDGLMPTRSSQDGNDASESTSQQYNHRFQPAGLNANAEHDDEIARLRQELQRETERSKSAKERLEREREEAERARARADEERARAEKERQALEQWREQEEAKLKRERRELERRGRELLQAPTKAQRSEVEHLKERNAELEREIEQKEAQHKQMESRLRNHASGLSNRLEEVSAERERSEKLRLEAVDELERLKSHGYASAATNGNATPAGKQRSQAKATQKVSQVPKLVSDGHNNQRPQERHLTRHEQPHNNARASSSAKDRKEAKSARLQAEQQERQHEKEISDLRFPKKPSLPKHPQQRFGVSGTLGSDPPAGATLRKVPSSNSNASGGRQNAFKKEEISLPLQGVRIVRFSNGTVKQVEEREAKNDENGASDGATMTTVFFDNGDVKRLDEQGKEEYYYAEVETWHTRKPRDEEDVYHFPSGQVEVHRKDSSKDVLFADGERRRLMAGGTEAELH